MNFLQLCSVYVIILSVRTALLLAVCAVISSCGRISLFTSKAGSAENKPVVTATVIPPVPVTGSYLTAILINDDFKPIVRAEVQAVEGTFATRTDDAGSFSLPVRLIKNDAVDLDVIFDNRALQLTVHLPVDLAEAVRNTDAVAEIEPKRRLAIRIADYQQPTANIPNQRFPAATFSLPVEFANVTAAGNQLLNFAVTSHKNGDVVAELLTLSGRCVPGHFISIRGDLFQGSGETKQCSNDGSSGLFEFDLFIQKNDGLKKLNISQSTSSADLAVTQLLLLNKMTPPAVPKLNAKNVAGLRATLTGTCDANSISHTASTSLGAIQHVKCLGDVLEVVVHLPSTSPAISDTTVFTVRVTSSNANGISSSSEPTSFTRSSFQCPSGYVGVPASGVAGLGNVNAVDGNANWWLDTNRDFCVMKYPAKNNNGSTFASSTMTGSPWVSIIRGADDATEGALKACKDAGAGHRLISNTQWQTVARNAEGVAANWSGNKVGLGMMARGHSDGPSSANNALENSTDDDPYFGTGDSGAAWNTLGSAPPAGSEQRRTQILSNGEVVWDFGGNVWQWVSDDFSSLGINPAIASGWNEYNNIGNFPGADGVAGINRLLFAPFGAFTSTHNAGRIFGGNSPSGVRRGGDWNTGAGTGIFATSVNDLANDSSIHFGFRCVFLP